MPRPGNARRAPTGGADGLALPSLPLGAAGSTRVVMMDDLIEVLAERSHIGWMKEKQAQGFADHPRTIDTAGRGCCTNDKHHPDMVPYADLDEPTKEYDRATVRGVLEGIEEAGYVIVTRDGLRQMGEAVALLNSMVLSGEDHSERSRAAVDYAASIAGALR